jgi:hypothetical protein
MTNLDAWKDFVTSKYNKIILLVMIVVFGGVSGILFMPMCLAAVRSCHGGGCSIIVDCGGDGGYWLRQKQNKKVIVYRFCSGTKKKSLQTVETERESLCDMQGMFPQKQARSNKCKLQRIANKSILFCDSLLLWVGEVSVYIQLFVTHSCCGWEKCLYTYNCL